MKEKSSDTDEGRTIFIRNLSFDTEENVLHDFFAHFGPLEFAKIVKDPATHHSRGTAFVKYANTDDALNVLNEYNSQNAHRFTLDNRTLCLSVAVSRLEANKLRKQQIASSDTVDEDISNSSSMVNMMKEKGRNLHLARFGMIRPGTSSAEGLSKEDLTKREAMLNAKKHKLDNPNFFINDCRLCVRNLPLDVSDQDLLTICMKILKSSTSVFKIKECRVMRNLQPGRQQNRSLGFAFITSDTHANAMKILQGLDNNPDLFPNHRRPIVEFCFENIKALQIKERRMQKATLVQTKQNSQNVDQSSTIKFNKSGNRIKFVKKKLEQSSAINHNHKKNRVLPKRFGLKNRHRDRALFSAKKSKSKQQKRNKLGVANRLTRTQKLNRKNQ